MNCAAGHHTCRWGLGTNTFDLDCKACEQEARERLGLTDAQRIVYWLDKKLEANERMGIRGSDIDMMREIRDDIAAGNYRPETWEQRTAHDQPPKGATEK